MLLRNMPLETRRYILHKQVDYKLDKKRVVTMEETIYLCLKKLKKLEDDQAVAGGSPDTKG